MKRYPKLRYPGEEETAGLFEDGVVHIQEKLDGSNFRFKRDGDGFRFGSRNTEGEELARGQFADAIEFVEEAADADIIDAWEDDLGELQFFGEAMNPHTISYDWETTPPFIGFDVWSLENELFLEVSQAANIFDDIGLPFSPVINRVAAEDWGSYEFEYPESAYYDGLAEGVVFKNHKTGTYGKAVRDGFKEKNKEAFGASNKKELSDTETLVEEYVPPARVRSVAHQLVDDGEWAGLQMEMMEDLPTAVIGDMVDEEGVAIFMSESKDIDLREFRSTVSSRCATVLRQMIDQQMRERMNGGVA